MNKQDKIELEKYREDVRAEKEKAEREAQENNRRDWAQRNGNDSGYDPYWNLA